jgi:hypothetical protein
MPVHDWTRVEAGIFHAFHHWWIGEISGILNEGMLPTGYYALPEQDFGPVGPDILTLQFPTGEARRGRPQPATEVGPATRAVIRHISDHRIVALIEVISPENKSSRSAVRTFVEKATTVMLRCSHLLVLDLFPPGRHDPQRMTGAIGAAFGDAPIELPASQPLTLASYTAGDPTRAWIEAIAVGDVLPEMPLFLLPEGYVNVPLESSYGQAWQHFPVPWREVLEARGIP